MKFGTPVMALAFSLLASAVWADTAQNDATPATDRAAVSVDGANGEQNWKVVNGESADGQNTATQDEQSASRQDEQEGDQSAAAGVEQGDRDHAAASDDSATDQTASDENASDAQQDQAAAMRDDDGVSDSSAASAQSIDENTDVQTSETAKDEGGDLMAALPNRDEDAAARALSSQAQAFQKFMESVQGKMVVILPQGWTGSVENLLESLKDSSGSSEVVVLSQRGDAANATSPSVDDEDDNDDDDDDDNS